MSKKTKKEFKRRDPIARELLTNRAYRSQRIENKKKKVSKFNYYKEIASYYLSRLVLYSPFK